MIQRCTGNQSGMTLIELVVVMALIGLTAAIAGVYMSSGETDLRTTIRNLQFDLEQAKTEALTRNTSVSVFIPQGTLHFDCNNDGSVDNKDRCYIVYQDMDGVAGFDPATDLEIKWGLIDPSIQVNQSQTVTFSPLGNTSPVTLNISTGVENDNCKSKNESTPCLATSYPLTINSVGRIHVGAKQQSCQGCS